MRQGKRDRGDHDDLCGDLGLPDEDAVSTNASGERSQADDHWPKELEELLQDEDASSELSWEWLFELDPPI